jgi:hypothetical protein
LACPRPIGHSLGTFPLGRHDEQRLAVSFAKHTREASTIKLERLEHLSPFMHTHATLVSHVGVPESLIGIKANAVRMVCRELARMLSPSCSLL